MRRLNVDEITNLGWVVLAAISVIEKMTHQEIPQDAKMTILEIAAGVSLYFNGKPSPLTEKLFKRVVGNDVVSTGNNGEFNRAGPAYDRSVVDVPRNEPTQPDRMAGLDTRLWVAPPENLSPSETKAAAWRAASIVRGQEPIEGTNVYGAEYAALSQSATEDEDGPQSEAWERRL